MHAIWPSFMLKVDLLKKTLTNKCKADHHSIFPCKARSKANLEERQKLSTERYQKNVITFS